MPDIKNRWDTLAMKNYKSLVMMLVLLPFAARAVNGDSTPPAAGLLGSAPAGEQLGVVLFPVSSSPPVQAAFNRGVRPAPWRIGGWR
jgi:hypothetical protein